MLFLFRWWAVACCAIAMVGLRAESTDVVNRTPPDVYASRIAPLITPFSAVAEGRTAFADGENDGTILLSETLHLRDTDGLLYRVQHMIYHARTASGAENLGSSIYRYDRERESLFLVEAATILADGTRVPVETKGAFIQTPQHQAANSLYTSQAELNIVFSKVAPGATTEALVLVRENTPLLPGEFCLNQTFGGAWPSYRRRLVVELGQDEWKRMNTKITSGTVPDATIESAGEGRERRVWAQSLQPRSHWEERSPEREYCLPTLWLSTMADWERIAQWMHGLVNDRSELGPELTAEVERLTQGITEPAKIVDVLHAAVANEVRYTGLEFGLAGYQPYPCRDVWQRRYGDCKDKANLLRAMLAHKGVKSHLALLNTNPLGRVERGSPSWQQFDHVILAVDDGAGGLRFCDPSIKHLPAGELGMGDLGRSVLLIRDGHADWVRTPDQHTNALRMKLDLALEADSELNGWFTFTAEGSDAASYADYYNGQERRDRVRTLQRMAERFVPGAEVADIDYVPLTGSVKSCTVRAYLRRPARSATGESLTFPYPSSWLPELTTVGERRLPYANTPREESLEATIKLPAGLEPAQLPAAFTAPSDAANFTARWELQDGALHASLRWRPSRLELTPAEYPVVQRSIRALTAWLAQPVTFRPASGTATVAAKSGESAPDLLAQFPVMPTGEGQLRLLDEKFPEGENNDGRRAALEKILQWFPQDQETVFTASVFLAQLNRKKDDPKAFAAELAALLKRLGAKVPVASRSWAEYLEARARWEASKDKTALEKMRKMAADESLSNYRRSWAAYEAGRFLGEKNPKEGAQYLAAYYALEGDAQDEIVSLSATLLFRAGDLAGLEKVCSTTAPKLGERADEALETAVAWIENAWNEAPPAARSGVIASLTRSLGTPAQFPAAHKRFAQLRNNIGVKDARQRFARDLAAWLKAHPPAWWTKKKDPKLANAAAVIAQIKAANDAKNADGVLDGTVQLIVHHEASIPEFAEYVRWSLWWLNKKDRDEEFFRELTRLALELPPAASSEVPDAWTTAAEHRAKKGDAVGAREIYERIAGDTALEEYQRVASLAKLAELERSLGRIDAALDAYRRLEPLHTQHRHGIDYLFAAVLLTVERGEFDRALELVASIRKQEMKYINEADDSVALIALLRAGEKPETLKAYWAHFQRWRPQWERFLIANGAEAGTPQDLPLATDWAANNDAVTSAVSKKDVLGFIHLLNQEHRVAAAVPLVNGNFISHSVRGSHLSAAQKRQLYECVLALVKNIPAVDPEFDPTARLWEAVMLNDLGRPTEAYNKALLLVAKSDTSTPLGQAAARVQAIAAHTPAQRTASAELLQQIFESKGAISDRPTTVAVYSDLLQNMKANARNRALLEREIARSDFDRTTPTGRSLVNRLAVLRKAGLDAEKFSAAVKQWLAQPGRDWVQHLQPSRLDEDRYARVAEPMEYNTPGFTEAEKFKFNLLFALDERVEIAKREIALRNAILAEAQASNDLAVITASVIEAAGSEVLSEENRAYLLRVVIWDVAVAGRADLLKKLTALSLFESRGESYRNAVSAILRGLEKVQPATAEAFTDALNEVVSQPLNSLGESVVNALLYGAVFAGHAEVAEEFLARTEKLALEPGIEKTVTTVRLGWTRVLTDARELAPFIAEVRKLSASLPGADAPCPPRIWNLQEISWRSSITPAECAARLSEHFRHPETIHRSLLRIIAMLRIAQIELPTAQRAGAELYELLVTMPLSDATRGALMFDTAQVMDSDEPAIGERMQRALATLLEPAAMQRQPRSSQVAKFQRALYLLRNDLGARPSGLFDPIETSDVPQRFLLVTQMHFYISRGQNERITTALETLDPSVVAESGLFSAVKAALLRSGREAESKLFTTAAREYLERSINSLWFEPTEAQRWSVMTQLLALPEFNSLATDEWFARIAAPATSPWAIANLDAIRARIRHDWPALKSATDRLLTMVPTLYDIYYERALAESELSLHTEALADLEVFLKHSRGSTEYQNALELKKKLQATPTLK